MPATIASFALMIRPPIAQPSLVRFLLIVLVVILVIDRPATSDPPNRTPRRRENDVDVLVLSESAIPPTTLLQRLNPPGSVRYHYTPSPSGLPSKVQTFFGYSPEFIKPVAEYPPRAAIWKIHLPTREEFLLCALHLPSKLYMGEIDLGRESVQLNSFIRDEEEKAGHSKTVVVGDFNMNPFQSGLTLADGFNAVMTRDVALQGGRRLSGRKYPFFYNPMWNHFGDGADRPCGTCFDIPSGYQSL
jgi:hypothetical protein